MAELPQGARVNVQGSGVNRYTLEHKGDVYSCTCPAWRNQGVRIELRTCKHLRAYIGDAVETARVGIAAAEAAGASAATAGAGRIRARRVSRFVEDVELHEERRAHLQRAIERYPVIDDRMQTVYGLRMPKHLAFAIGFWMGLTDAERAEAWAYLGNGPAGVGQWFLDGMIEPRRVIPGLDERLEFRYRCDPPEMVTIFTGNSDGGHWGLWYDDPKELPTTIVHNYARDSAETGMCERTLLKTLRELVAREGDDPYDPAEWPHRTGILAWLDEVLELETDAYEEQRSFWPGPRPSDLLGGMASIDPAWLVPDELVGYKRQRERQEAYKRRDPVVKAWIALALRELTKDGSAGRALFLGRELHWVDANAWREDCTELLVSAYEALDRHALAEIVRVHHKHRDLESVAVYETPARSTFSTILLATHDDDADVDVDAIRSELETNGLPSLSDLAESLRDVTDLRVLDVLLELVPQVPGAHAAAERAAAEHVDAAIRDALISAGADVAESPRMTDLAAARRAAAMRIFDRCGATGKAFTYALGSTPVVRASALRNADLAWRSSRGRSVLHIAAGIPFAEAVGALLDRGADPRLRDHDGKTPYDAALNVWERNTREANAVFELLKARGGGPEIEKKSEDVKAATKPGWSVGTAVRHSKFGDGVVEAVVGVGAGEKAKLTIKFATSTKVLVAKFVTRV